MEVFSMYFFYIRLASFHLKRSTRQSLSYICLSGKTPTKVKTVQNELDAGSPRGEKNPDPFNRKAGNSLLDSISSVD